MEHATIRNRDIRQVYLDRASAEFDQWNVTLQRLEAKHGETVDVRRAQKQLSVVERRLQEVRQYGGAEPNRFTNLERGLMEMERLCAKYM